MKLRYFVVLAFALLGLALVPEDGRAGPVTVKGHWVIPNQTGQDANDFDMDVYSDSNLVLQGSDNDQFKKLQVTPSIFNPLVKHVHWFDGTVEAGGHTHLGLEFTQNEKNSVNIQSACWTKDGKPIGNAVCGGLKLPGFEVTPYGAVPNQPNGATLRLRNDTDSDMFIGNFSFSVNPTPVSLQSMDFNQSGLGTDVPDFYLAANSFFDVFTELSIPPGDFLLFQGQAFDDQQHTTMESEFVYEHEHGTIPEPASLVLVGLGLLGIAGVRRRHQGHSSTFINVWGTTAG